MRIATRAFTLIELLTVVAIVAMLAGMLTPAFLAAKNSAKQTVCASHFKQVATANSLYLDDYDDRFTPVSYSPGKSGSSRTDRTWVQLLLPYAPNFSVFVCPSDTSRSGNLDATFDKDIVVGDLYSEYYSASQRTNIGFNYMALSPVIREGYNWISVPRTFSQISQPSSMMMYVDSVWSLSTNGQPTGGGNWLVEPPCRYISRNGNQVDLFAADGKAFGDVYSTSEGWSAEYGAVYGGAWPWHQGHMNLIHADGSVKAVTPAALGVGCDVKANWGGEVQSPDQYMWTVY